MSIYGNKDIKAALKTGKIVCRPLIEENINAASINVTLGRYYYRTEHATDSAFYNPFSKTDVMSYFVGPFEAVEHGAWAEEAKVQLLENIPAEHPVIVLKPGERILAHTHEFIGIKPPGTSNMLARSTWGRNGLAVCFDAGWGDPGYINRWTMELYNLNQHHSMVLPIGECIAQIVFYQTGPVDKDYTQLSGKYQESGELSQLMKNWKPESMLPKAYLDKRHRPLKTES